MCGGVIPMTYHYGFATAHINTMDLWQQINVEHGFCLCLLFGASGLPRNPQYSWAPCFMEEHVLQLQGKDQLLNRTLLQHRKQRRGMQESNESNPCGSRQPDGSRIILVNRHKHWAQKRYGIVHTNCVLRWEHNKALVFWKILVT